VTSLIFQHRFANKPLG